jgi:hypothetical protein
MIRHLGLPLPKPRENISTAITERKNYKHIQQKSILLLGTVTGKDWRRDRMTKL